MKKTWVTNRVKTRAKKILGWQRLKVTTGWKKEHRTEKKTQKNGGHD